MGKQGLLKSLGVRIRRVADIDEGAIYMPNHKLLLLDIELSDELVSDAIESVLPSLWHSAG